MFNCSLYLLVTKPTFISIFSNGHLIFVIQLAATSFFCYFNSIV